MGILFAIIALVSWGLGDFLIQKSTRRTKRWPMGLLNTILNRGEERSSKWIVLFYITFTGAIILTPFIFGKIQLLSWPDIGLLTLVSVVILSAALMEFQALKIGKLSVVEPAFALEIPVTALLAGFLLQEKLNSNQIFLIAVLIIGIFLVSVKDLTNLKKVIWEKGAGLAVVATLTMGAVNFLVGFSSRQTDPLMTNWFLNVFVAVVSFIYLIKHGQAANTFSYLKENTKLILNTCLFDNLAWIAFAFSMTQIPIAIATGISESYIILAVGLGFVFNKEKLRKHQITGLVVAVIAAVILAMMVEK